jgi:hypothetical protein
MTDSEIIERAWRLFEEYKVSQESRDEFAEVHTPKDLAEDMLSEIPDRKFEDPEATFLDPCSGVGAPFPLAIAERLVENGISYEHAMENQIYMVELQPKNCVMIERLLNPTGELNLNLKCCDALELDVKAMKPEDWRSERFRTDYGNQYSFFKREPKQKELERLEEIRKLTDDDQIIERFEQGYV